MLKYPAKNQSGFTKIELLIAFVFILILLIATALPSYDPGGANKARESEVKANLHSIQIAIERYFVDNQKYPSFLLGGDMEGWYNWHLMNDDEDPSADAPSNNLVCDVLIKYGYMTSYPKNPFVNDGMKIIKSTSAFGSAPGDGDPRFGFNGRIIGNGLSDPAFYIHRSEIGIPPIITPLIETRRTLSDITVKQLGFLEPPDGIHYMMGGRKSFDKKGNVITVATWWPGNFFYRGLFNYPLQKKGWGYDPGWFGPSILGAKRELYILGAYGSTDTPGLDVIRLETRNWFNTDDVYYRLPAPWFEYAKSSGIKCGWSVDGSDPSGTGSGLPEVCGGGDAFTGPIYPYNRGDSDDGYTYGKYIFGAPDGHPDGIILVLTSGNGINSWE